MISAACSDDAFQCLALIDGCIPMEKVYDGKVDCPTHEDDEAEGTYALCPLTYEIWKVFFHFPNWVDMLLTVKCVKQNKFALILLSCS